MVGAAEYASAQLTMGGGLNKDCIDMNIQEDICWTSSIPPVPYPCAHLSFWQPKWIVETAGGVRQPGRRPLPLPSRQGEAGRSGLRVQRSVHGLRGADPERGGRSLLRLARRPGMEDGAARLGDADGGGPATHRLVGAAVSAGGVRDAHLAAVGVGAGGNAGVQPGAAAAGPVAGGRKVPAGRLPACRSAGRSCRRPVRRRWGSCRA